MPATQRRSSGPPRANARKDEEGDQHGGEARKPYRGLSNELIRKIYDQVFAADSSIAWPGLREILVSKRIYHVARPAYLHTIEVDSCEYTTDAVIAGLLSDEHACSAVRTLKMTVFLRSEKTTAALLARLPNLRVLTLYFEHEYSSTGGSSEPLSEFFLRQLARIPRLRQLDFAEPSGIERLAIAVTDIPTILELGPWASLRHLVTVFETYEEPSSDNSRLIDFLGAQLAKYCGPTPLRALSIVMDSKIDGFVGVVRSAFSTFAPRGVTTFCFRTAGTARFDLSDSAFDYNNIRYVDIASAIPYELAKGRKFTELVHFIQKLPALRRFALYGLVVSGDGRPLELAGLDETQVIAEYPLLFALLSSIARTSVTTLSIVPAEEQLQKRYTWKRLSRDKSFRLE
ncbi:hypothetical protein B0A53_02943 [Rhodotorula sp. CCFEE 5036]|nr:hypothetical protein B0A53_02943 [Rhodotorula sp. CCFEE 5036]